MDPSTPATRDDRLMLVLRAPLQFEPGTQFCYSSPAFLVVGVVTERLSGSSRSGRRAGRIRNLLGERIPRPLRLASTVSGSRPMDVVQGHQAGEPVEPWDLASMIGSGDMCSSAEDLVAYAHALDAGALVSRDSLALMCTQHSPFREADRSPDGRLEVTGYGYGYGIGTLDGRSAALHTGDNPGYKSSVGWLPDGVGIVALSNDDSIQVDVLRQVL